MTQTEENPDKTDLAYQVSLKMNKKIVDIIDDQCKYNRMSRTAWISQAVLDKLARLGVEIHENKI